VTHRTAFGPPFVHPTLTMTIPDLYLGFKYLNYDSGSFLGLSHS